MRQARSYVASVLRERGITANRRLGQCFLVDGNLLGIVAAEADLGPADFVLEIGTGTGQLTELIAADAGRVFTVEIDRELCCIARENLDGFGNVEILNADALDGKRRMNPLVSSRLREASAACGALKMVSNLPYGVALPVIQNLLAEPVLWERMVVTVQKEFADKMIACPGSAAYGAFSVLFQSAASAAVRRALKPSVFWPVPGVDSALVVVVPRGGRPGIADDALFAETVRKAFSQRRKKLANSLGSWLSGMGLDAAALLESAGVDPGLRPEDVDVAGFAAVALAIGAAGEPGKAAKRP